MGLLLLSCRSLVAASLPSPTHHPCCDLLHCSGIDFVLSSAHSSHRCSRPPRACGKARRIKSTSSPGGMLLPVPGIPHSSMPPDPNCRVPLKHSPRQTSRVLVGRLGFEPRQSASKALDLPLVDRPLSDPTNSSLTREVSRIPSSASGLGSSLGILIRFVVHSCPVLITRQGLCQESLRARGQNTLLSRSCFLRGPV